MSPKYKCLVFDHDDTVVNSTATIHHPCFQEFLNIYRPGMTCSLEDYFVKNFTPGFLAMCTDEYSFTDEDFAVETDFWNDYVKDHIPAAYPGIKEIMDTHKAKGGLIAVVSHSFSHYIYRDYEKNNLPRPDIVFGWDCPAELRKPDPYPLKEIMRTYNLQPAEMLVIDDLKPGYDMARAVDVPFAAARWANDIGFIEDFMRRNCDNYFKTVEDLADFLAER